MDQVRKIVKVTIHIQLKRNTYQFRGKASPKSVKTYNNNSSIGTFLSTSVDDGQKVKQGDRLINYDTNASKREQLANKVNQAQSQVNDDYQKINQSPNNSQLQSKLTQDQSSLNEAQQSLAQHDRQVNDSMYASFDGKVNIKNDSDVGDGQPILQLISDNPQINATVTEFDINKIKEGDKVDVTVNSTGKKAKVRLSKLMSFLLVMIPVVRVKQLVVLKQAVKKVKVQALKLLIQL